MRFAREAHVLSELVHPAIVRHVAHGATAEGSPYLAMEWLEGEDLGARLGREPLTSAESLLVARRTAEALSLAHGRGIVHRDIKPSNIFLVAGEPGGTKVLDFGVARATRFSHALTQTGAVIGTLGYMSPEQARGSRALDARADIFSLGCVLYECLTGAPAFEGEHPAAVLACVLLEEPPLLRTLRPELGEDLERLLAEMLAKRPEERPDDAEAVLARLDGLGETVDAGRPSPGRGELSLTDGERRFLSVLLIAPAAPAAPGHDPTLTPEELEEGAGRVRPLAERYGGEVSGLADGTVLIVFRGGAADGASENAQRAARCGLAVRAEHLEARLALACGLAEVRDRWPVGPVVERAASLLASPSSQKGVAMHPADSGLLESLFVVELGDGCSSLTRERADTGSRRLLGKRTPFVGRARELSFLESVADECREEHVAQVVLMVAPAGAGKSRIRHELVSLVEAGARVVIGRTDPVYAGASLALAKELVRRAAFTGRSTGFEAILSHVDAVLPGPDGSRIAELLGELIGVPPEAPSPRLRAARNDGDLMRDQLREAYVEWLGALAASRPVLVVLEDVHWADRGSLQLVEHALREHARSPLMVLATARPEVDEVFPGLWVAVDVQRLSLAPLRRRAGEQLVESVLASLGPDERRALVERSGGNAFYLEELIRHTAEHGIDTLPESVLAMAQQRFATLEPSARRILRAASIFGEVFWVGALARLLGEGTNAADLEPRLARLFEAEYLEPSPDPRFAGETQLAFRHGLLRDAAYAALTERDRTLGHRVAAEWLEAAGEPNAKVVAEHFERGGAAERAVPHFLRAATLALQAGYPREAGSLAERGVACGAEGQVRGELRAAQCEAGGWAGDELGAYVEIAEEALELLPEGSGRWLLALTAIVWGSVFSNRFDRLEGPLLHVQRLRRISPDEHEGLAVLQLIVGLFHAGYRDEVTRLVEQLDELVVETGSGMDAWRSMIRAWLSLFGHGDRNRVLPLYLSAREAMRTIGHRLGETMAEHGVGMAALEQGDLDLAEEALNSAYELAERGGTGLISMYSTYILGVVDLLRGRFARGVSRIIETTESNDVVWASMARVNLALFHLKAGRVDEAEPLLARALVDTVRLPVVHAQALALRARMDLDAGNAQAAARNAREGLALFEHAGGWSSTGRALHKTLAKIGAPSTA